MKTVTAKNRERTIKLAIKFATNEIASNKSGEIIPKHAWDSGWVMMIANPSHGLKSTLPRNMYFNSMAELPAKIEEVLVAHGVTLHHDRKGQKLFAAGME
jgi:hypothetical protein